MNESTETLTIAQRIIAARQDAQLSAADVSRLIAVKPETYGKWESGDKQPRANKLVMLAGVLNVVPAWLLDGDDDYLQSLDRDSVVVELKQRIKEMQAEQVRMKSALDELARDIDTIARQD